MSQLSLSGPCIILWCCLSSTGLYCLPVYLTTPKSTSQPPQSILQTPQSTSQLPVHLTTPPVYPTTPSPPYNPPVHLTTRQSTSQPPVYLTTPSPPHNPQSTPQPPVYLTTPQSTSQTQSTSQSPSRPHTFTPVYLTTVPHKRNYYFLFILCGILSPTLSKVGWITIFYLSAFCECTWWEARRLNLLPKTSM